jgi:hypothetical protein
MNPKTSYINSVLFMKRFREHLVARKLPGKCPLKLDRYASHYNSLAALQVAVMSRDSSVGIALGYGLKDRDSTVRFPAGLGIFPFTIASRTALGPTQPPIQWVPAALSLGIKRPSSEADHSPPSSAEVKECVEQYLHSPIRLHGVVFR